MYNEALTDTVKRAVEYALQLRLGEFGPFLDLSEIVSTITEEVVGSLTKRVSLDNLIFEATKRLHPGLVYELKAKVVRVDDHVDVTEMTLLPKLTITYQQYGLGGWQTVDAAEIREDHPVKHVSVVAEEPLDSRCPATHKREAAVKVMQNLGFKWDPSDGWGGVASIHLWTTHGEVFVIGPKAGAAEVAHSATTTPLRRDKYDELATALGTDVMDTHESRIDKAKKADRAINTLNNMGFQYLDHVNGWMRKTPDARW